MNQTSTPRQLIRSLYRKAVEKINYCIGCYRGKQKVMTSHGTRGLYEIIISATRVTQLTSKDGYIFGPGVNTSDKLACVYGM